MFEGLLVFLLTIQQQPTAAMLPISDAMLEPKVPARVEYCAYPRCGHCRVSPVSIYIQGISWLTPQDPAAFQDVIVTSRCDPWIVRISISDQLFRDLVRDGDVFESRPRLRSY